MIVFAFEGTKEENQPLASTLERFIERFQDEKKVLKSFEATQKGNSIKADSLFKKDILYLYEAKLNNEYDLKKVIDRKYKDVDAIVRLFDGFDSMFDVILPEGESLRIESFYSNTVDDILKSYVRKKGK